MLFDFLKLFFVEKIGFVSLEKRECFLFLPNKNVSPVAVVKIPGLATRIWGVLGLVTLVMAPLIFLGCLFFILPSYAHASTCTWTGASSTAWATSTNWSCGAVPGSGDDVVINGNGSNAPTVDYLGGPRTINSLTLGTSSVSTLTFSNCSTSTKRLIVNGDVVIGAAGVLTHATNTVSQTHVINFEATNLTIVSGGRIEASYKGYRYSEGLGQGVDGGGGCGGGSYGGQGGAGLSTAAGSTYGSLIQPSDIGSGGGDFSTRGGSGGGAIKIVITGTSTISGYIYARGAANVAMYAGGGSGGSIWFTTDTLAGTGTVSVIGGNGYSASFDGSGGGGRIAVYYATDVSSIIYQAYGGSGWVFGGAGTIYKKASSSFYGDLIIDNNNQDLADDRFIGKTNLTETITYNTITVQNYGYIFIAPTANITYSTLNWSTKGIIADNGGTFDLVSGGGNLAIASSSKLLANVARTFTGLTVNGTLSHSGNFVTAQYALDYAINGDCTVNPGGTINVSYKGFQHGEGTGQGISSNGPSGGSFGGLGGKGSNTSYGLAYGSTTQPSEIGSGGGDRTTDLGGAGGGRIKMVVTGTTTVSGNILADGANYVTSAGGGGSGGSIWISTNTLSGSSTLISANGGTGNVSYGGGGGGGRIAIYYETDFSTFISYQAYGGTGWAIGGAGTVYKKASSSSYGDLIINNNNQDPLDQYGIGKTILVSADTFNQITILNYGYLEITTSTNATYSSLDWSTRGVIGDSGGTFALVSGGGSVIVPTSSRLYANYARTFAGLAVNGFAEAIVPVNTSGDFTVGSAGTVTHRTNATTSQYVLDITAANFTLASGGKIDANYKGYRYGEGPGQGADSSGGASYGGQGGAGNVAAPGSVYGSLTQPSDIGSGGGDFSARGGSGGGAVKISVSGTSTIAGNISAKGSPDTGPYAGGGSGGSIWLTTGALIGTGTVSVIGGNGIQLSFDGAGGGGRIAVYYTSDNSSLVYQAYGGTGWSYGGAGTIFKKASGASYGDLIIDNNNQDVADDQFIGKTTITETVTFNTITIQNYGYLNIASVANIAYSTLNWSTKGIIADNGGIFDLVSGGGTLSIASSSRLLANTARSFTGLSVDGVLSHSNNATTSQYGIDFAISGNCLVNPGGAIDASFKGFQHGEGVGQGADGQGASGGSYGGLGAKGSAVSSGLVHGSLTQPFSLGSGGGDYSTSYGGSGGGRIKIAVTGTTTVSGNILAKGANYTATWAGGGSGGSIWLTTGTLAGSSSSITVTGGTGQGTTGIAGSGGGGGGGRIAVYYTTDISSSLAYQAYGGAGGYAFGGAGTIYLKAGSSSSGDLIIDNNNQNPVDDYNTGRTILNSTEVFNTITIQNYGYLDIATSVNAVYSVLNWSTKGVIADNGGIFALASSNASLTVPITSLFYNYYPRTHAGYLVNGYLEATVPIITAGDFTIGASGTVTHRLNISTKQYVLDISAANFTIPSGGKIDLNRKGYRYSEGPGQGVDSTGGGSYGGRGGRGSSHSAGVAYGSSTQPTDLGSGGGEQSGQYGGAGGGAIKLTVPGITAISGNITSRGGDYVGAWSGAGSGGSIWINTGTLSGTGTVSVSGGNGTANTGAGGGGRIAIYYVANNSNLNVSASGGTTGYRLGNPGTIVFNNQFVSIIDPSQSAGYDYNSLSAWESATQNDLTLPSNKAFGYSGKIGNLADGASVTGSTTAKKAEVVHVSATQIFLKDIRTPLTGTTTMTNASTTVTGVSTVFTTAIAEGQYIWNETDKLWFQVATITSDTLLSLTSNYTGTGGSARGAVRSGNFSSGERVKVDNNNYVTITDNGYQAIAVANCRTSASTADTASTTIDGWNTSPENYIKIWTDPTGFSRHSGIWDNAKYRLDVASGTALSVKEENVTIAGLQIASGDDTAIYVGSTTATSSIYISNNLIKGNASDTKYGLWLDSVGSSSVARIWNNIIYDYSGASSSAIYWNDSDWTIYAYNNTLYNSPIGFNRGTDTAQYLKNNLIVSANAFFGTFTDSDTKNDYNSISENLNDSAIGGHGRYNQTFKFSNEAGKNFLLSSNDVAARNLGLNLMNDANLSFSDDIKGERRPVTTGWDIGAGENVTSVMTFKRGVRFLRGVIIK